MTTEGRSSMDNSRAMETVWRRTTADEIQPGWEVRLRRTGSFGYASGIAHHRGPTGTWYTEDGAALTADHETWISETSEPKPDERVQAWDSVAKHPFFADCYASDGTLVDAMLAKLDDAHAHTCEPVWRPVTREEIRAGWEIRTRLSDRMEGKWGIAHRRADHGDWFTEAGARLTSGWTWTYETTAPAPESTLTERIRAALGDSPESRITLDVADVEALLDALTEGDQS